MFFFNDTATTEIYTLSLHDALPISETHLHNVPSVTPSKPRACPRCSQTLRSASCKEQKPLSNLTVIHRSEEHTSELQSRQYLVCRLLLEKKNSSPSNITYAVFFFTK